MRPRRLVINKTLDELRRSDRASPPAAASVFHVSEFGIDHLVVFGRERHAPHQFAGFEARFGQAIGELVVVGKHAGIFLPERDNNGASERGQIDHEFRLETLRCVPDYVGQARAGLRRRC